MFMPGLVSLQAVSWDSPPPGNDLELEEHQT